MKILYFAHSVLSRGGDKIVLAHLNHLAASGHQVVITTAVMDTLFQVHPDISIVLLPFKSRAGTLFTALSERYEADCVLASIVPTAVCLSLRNRRRTVQIVQDDNQTGYDSLLVRFVVGALYHIAFSMLAIPTISVSSGLADILKRKYKAECKIVPNGVDTTIFYPSPSADLLLAKDGRKSILLLSRSDLRKGFDIARNIIGELQQGLNLPFEVWTVGEEAAWGDVPGIYRNFGTLGEQALSELMSSADVFICPSRSEGFGLMVLEAFACRCPVVTSSAITFAEDNKNALVARVGDVKSMAGKVMQILTDDHLAKKLTDEAYNFAQQNRIADSSMQFEKELTLLLR